MSALSNEFQDTLQHCLDEAQDKNPPKVGSFIALLPLLLQLLIQAADGCLASSTPKAIAESAVAPGPIVKARMRRLMIRDMFDGSPRKYREHGGDDMLEATFKAARMTGPENVQALIQEVKAAPDPDALSRMG